MTVTKNRTYPIVKATAYGAFALGLGLSVTHAYDLFHSTLGASVVTAAAVPVFVDGFQVVGRLIRGDGFARSTRRVGWVLQIVGALISLTANILAGHTPGDRIGGAIFVLGYIAFDAIAHVIRPHAEDTDAIAAQAAAALTAKRQAAAAKGQATRAANKAKKATAARAAARKARAAEIAATAPVSAPPTVDYDTAPYV